MQTSPDSIYEYAQNLDLGSLKNLGSSSKDFFELFATDRFQQLIKRKYEESFPTIHYKDEIYKYDVDRKIYLGKNKTEILVTTINEENWKPHKDGKFILKQASKPNKDNIINIEEDNYYFDSVTINLDWYDKGIHYIHFEDCSDDAGETSTGFNVSKYLEYYEPEMLEKINKIICESKKDEIEVTWDGTES